MRTGELDIGLRIDDKSSSGVTTFTFVGPYVLVVQTVIPPLPLATELQSVFNGHPGEGSAVSHLLLTRSIRDRQLRTARVSFDPVQQPRDCLYEHALTLVGSLAKLGYHATVDVANERVFRPLEQVS